MHKLLLDCDNTLGLFGREIDDGLALLYFFGRADVDLLGITTVFGNGSIEQVHRQTGWLLDKLGREKMTLHRGAARAAQSATSAAEFLAETVSDAPGEIGLLALGPLTNVWGAAQLDPGFFSNLKYIYCMGGFTHPVRKGWRHVGELNFSADPKAAAAVLEAPCPVSVCNAHICFSLSFGWSDLQHVAFMPPWLLRTVRSWLLAFGLYQGVSRFYLWDLLPALLLTDPDFFESAWTRLDASEANLRAGWLTPSERGGVQVRMPIRILDAEACKEAVFQAWMRGLDL